MLCGAVVACAVGASLFHVPFEVSDNLGDLLQVADASVSGMFLSNFTQPGFMRPAAWATSAAVFGVAPEHLFYAYRTVHLASLATIVFSLVTVLRVRSATTCALAVVSLMILIGLHPLQWALNETELNIKLIVTACCLLTLVLAVGAPAGWRDGAALVLVAYAMLGNEIGLIAWVTLTAAYLVGFRGVSGRAVAVATALLAVYFYLRFVQFHVGAPALSERSSGFGLRIRSPQELTALFGEHPLPFYLYNVASALLSLLVSEPRNGVFVAVRDALADKLAPATVVNVVVSATTTGLMAWFAGTRLRRWMRLDFEDRDRLFLVTAGAVAANACISYPYLKDVVMCTAAVFYPIAAFVAMEAFAERLISQPIRRLAAVGAMALLLVLSVGWSMRGVGFFVNVRQQAYRAQADWVAVDDWLAAQRIRVETPAQRALVDRLRVQMLGMTPPKVYLDPQWSGAWFGGG